MSLTNHSPYGSKTSAPTVKMVTRSEAEDNSPQAAKQLLERIRPAPVIPRIKQGIAEQKKSLLNPKRLRLHKRYISRVISSNTRPVVNFGRRIGSGVDKLVKEFNLKRKNFYDAVPIDKKTTKFLSFLFKLWAFLAAITSISTKIGYACLVLGGYLGNVLGKALGETHKAKTQNLIVVNAEENTENKIVQSGIADVRHSSSFSAYGMSVAEKTGSTPKPAKSSQPVVAALNPSSATQIIVTTQGGGASTGAKSPESRHSKTTSNAISTASSQSFIPSTSTASSQSSIPSTALVRTGLSHSTAAVIKPGAGIAASTSTALVAHKFERKRQDFGMDMNNMPVFVAGASEAIQKRSQEIAEANRRALADSYRQDMATLGTAVHRDANNSALAGGVVAKYEDKALEEAKAAIASAESTMKTAGGGGGGAGGGSKEDSYKEMAKKLQKEREERELMASVDAILQTKYELIDQYKKGIIDAGAFGNELIKINRAYNGIVPFKNMQVSEDNGW